MSEFFDENDPMRFLEDLEHEREHNESVRAQNDLQNRTNRNELINVLGEQGIIATIKDPSIDDSAYEPTISVTVVATPDTLTDLSVETQSAWSTYTESLLMSKAFAELGAGDEDAFAIEAATEALAAILTSDGVSINDKQIAVQAAKAFIGQGLVAQSLVQWGFNPEQELADDPLFETRVALIKMEDNNIVDQDKHNREVKYGLRPRVQAALSTILPIEHDDFKTLLSRVEVAIQVQFYPRFKAAKREGNLEDELRQSLLGDPELIDRNQLDVDELVKIALNMAPGYEALGYRCPDREV